MNAPATLSLAEVEEISLRALRAAGADEVAAGAVAAAIVAAERDGIPSHGLAYLPTYCEHLICGKVDRAARPSAAVTGSVVRVDAGSGFAHPAIALGFAHLIPLARELGSASLAIRNSYNCGVLGYHTEALAAAGLVALGFTNAPASIAPSGALRPVLGTNPWSVAVPDGHGGAAIVIDQSASVVAKSEVMKRARLGESIPSGWAFAKDGRPTTDPAEALKGTMAPAGGYKGVGSALLVELFAACLTGATLGTAASPFSGTAGGPPRTGQFFLAVDPGATAGELFETRLGDLVAAFTAEDGVRLPGSRRTAHRERARAAGITVDGDLLNRVRALVDSAT